MKQIIGFCAVITVGMLLTGCTHDLTGIEPSQVENKRWILISQDGRPVSGPRVTMEMRPVTAQDGRIGGQAQCNRYFGSYQVTNNTLHFSPMGGSRAACPAPFMTKEAEYLSVFPKLNDITFKDSSLELSHSGGYPKLSYVSESASLGGQITTSQGNFPAGSDIIIVLQDSSMPEDPAGIVGIESIQVGRDVDVVDYVVNYAPELVKANGRYELIAEVIQNGQLVYMTTIRPAVQLKSAPVKQ
ncbi:META domain-containing protein [Endozoicomonas ascidiicola]|uniref:META domain-containing protein n=1 Tax=Endozoicomonas ascidiicola TaxID=1698521 RepID=UPI000834E5CA|nr:META domain-containing protein [Endozoicomonas ascidiicola]